MQMPSDHKTEESQTATDEADQVPRERGQLLSMPICASAYSSKATIIASASGPDSNWGGSSS